MGSCNGVHTAVYTVKLHLSTLHCHHLVPGLDAASYPLLQDAMTAFECALDHALDARAAFNLSICAAADRGTVLDPEVARLHMQRLIQVSA